MLSRRFTSPILVASLMSATSIWAGFVDSSTALQTTRFIFSGTTNGEGPGNENYYDGDFGDFNRDGYIDRALGARYGLLINRGDGWMDFFGRRTNFEYRGASPSGINGEDCFQWADIDNDDDMDVISGGNGEKLAVQVSSHGYFTISQLDLGSAALGITNTDLDGDGFVDLVVCHAFCADSGCGGPLAFNIFQNDGAGLFTKVTSTSGLNYLTQKVSNGKYGVTGVTSADVDMDGDYDLIICHGHETVSSLRFAEVALNDGTGLFTTHYTDITPPGSGFGTNMTMGDIDDDGDLDLVRIGGNSSHPIVGHQIGINDGAGNFFDESDVRFVGEFEGDANHFTGSDGALFDVDYDGDLDLVVTNGGNNPIAMAYITIFKNNGAGVFTFDDADTIHPVGLQGGIGADTDITDLDADGDLDIWLGRGGDHVQVFLNDYVSPDGLPANMPRNLSVSSVDGTGVTIRWEHPTHAVTNRHYKIYRSTAPNLEVRDRELLKIIGQRHEDEKFFAPITRHTTTAYLNDPAVVMDGPNNAVFFTDITAVPGVMYYYSLRAVETENTPGRPTGEVSATVPYPGGVDTTAPQLHIASPNNQDWDQFPRIVVAFGDDSSGINLSSLSISISQPLGDGTPADTNLAGSFQRKDATTYVYPMTPPRTIPVNLISTLTVSIADNNGNLSTQQASFFPIVTASATTANDYPTAAFTESGTSGDTPFSATLDATSSHDNTIGSSFPKDAIYMYEWYFSDGTYATGRKANKTFTLSGDYTVMLLIRDNEGSVHTVTKAFTVNRLFLSFGDFVTAEFTAPEQADPTISGPNADPDSDNMNNLLEYALHTDPKKANQSGIQITQTAGQLVFFYDKVYASDLTWQWKHSTDLIDWQPITPATENMVEDHADFMEMEASFNLTGPSSDFYLLEISTN